MSSFPARLVEMPVLHAMAPSSTIQQPHSDLLYMQFSMSLALRRDAPEVGGCAIFDAQAHRVGGSAEGSGVAVTIQSANETTVGLLNTIEIQVA
jgi:hypothetical protein